MADCGATGSTIDRTAAAVVEATTGVRLTNSNNQATKHVTSFLGNAAMAGAGTGVGAAAAMPTTAPELIVMPDNNITNSYNNTPMMMKTDPSSARQQQQQQQQQRQHMMMQQQQKQMNYHQHHHPSLMRHHQQHHHHLQQQQMFLQQQQRQHQHIMAQQQQQQQMQMQQQHHMNIQMAQQMESLKQQKMALLEQRSKQKQQQQEQREKHQQQQQEQQQQHHENVNNVDLWHEGLLEETIDANVLQNAKEEIANVITGHEGLVNGVSINELSNAWKEVVEQEEDGQHTVSGHEGLVNGASIEELAKAWAEVEEQYAQEEDITENVTNLWSGAGNDAEGEVLEQDLRTYEYMTIKESSDPDIQEETENEQHQKDEEEQDYMDLGMKQFNDGLTLEAIKSFEYVLARLDNDNVTAWQMLGKCHAENDDDRRAISCLENAIERDPYSLSSLLSLGVSYVNELNSSRALHNIKSYITHNPKYDTDFEEAIADEQTELHGNHNNKEESERAAFNEVQNLLLKALEYDSDDETSSSSDLYEALGVVYNVSRDYDKAVECFEKALEIKPNDYTLWNKLGATKANSNRSDEALVAYEKALQMKPRYARAWLNMAISHSNLSNYDDAARCYLQTLSLNPNAVHCWSYLRIALSCNDQWELIKYTAEQNIDEFHNHYDFV